MKILGKEIGDVKDLLTTVSILIGAAWFLFNFNLTQENKTDHLNVEIELDSTGSQETEIGKIKYVNYSYSIKNESEREISIAAAIISFFGHSVSTSEFLTFETVLNPTATFSSSDFIVQSDSNKSFEYGISAGLSGYRLSPGEAATFQSTQYLYNETPDEGLEPATSDSIQAQLDIYSVSRCERYLFFFKSCHDHFGKLHKELSVENCPENSFKRVSNIGARCVQVLRLEKQADEALGFIELDTNSDRISHYRSSVTIPNI